MDGLDQRDCRLSYSNPVVELVKSKRVLDKKDELDPSYGGGKLNKRARKVA